MIVPVYNERNTLRELLERVRARPLTWQRGLVELEIVVVDDCSNDGGVDFLERPESRGLNYNLDYPGLNPDWAHRDTIIQKTT